MSPSLNQVSGFPALVDYPHVSGRVRAQEAKRIGAAGERLVDSYLIRWGFHPFEAPESEPFDRLFLVSDHLLRMQVKTVTYPKGRAYLFPMEQGHTKCVGGRHKYAHGAFDIAALVILPEDAIYFTSEMRGIHRVAISELPHPAAQARNARAAFGSGHWHSIPCRARQRCRPAPCRNGKPHRRGRDDHAR
ncbi:hypothetical protein PUH89_08990 [Rhodobacter capsulatus]|uniref:hypothetical protein n=1 Tax=Rhodobacter capsulatus TaxID=1061 RepID=UPI0011137027|nr:hypothetical protein [Rhodobacter capsulatus]WER11085.1 hypothetical protein PUH89_08990 [Rhodobacter capsulatus]